MIASPPRKSGGGLARVAIRNAISAIVTRTSSVLVGLLITPTILHALGTERYGIMATTSSAYEYIALLRGGLAAALRRYVTLAHHGGRPEEAREVFGVGFWWSGLLRALILVICASLARPLCAFLRVPPEIVSDTTFGIILIFGAAVLADGAAIFEIPVYATGNTARISWLRAVVAWARLGITIGAFAVFRPSLVLYGWTLVLVEALPVVGLMVMASRANVVGPVLPRPTMGTAEMRRRLFSYGGMALLAQVAGLLYTSADKLLIGRFYGAALVTHYDLGVRWSPLIQSFISGSIASLTPIFTRFEASGEGERSREALVRVIGWTSAFAVTACLVPCVMGDLFLVRWVGAEYRDSHHYMIAVLAPLTLELALAPVWMALLARGRIGWIAAGDLIVAVAKVLFSLVLVLGFQMGLMGFALGNTTALLAKNLLLRPIAGRRDGTLPPMSVYLRILARALGGGAPALALLYLARPLYGGHMATILVASGLAAALCLAGSLALTVGPAGVRQMVTRTWR